MIKLGAPAWTRAALTEREVESCQHSIEAGAASKNPQRPICWTSWYESTHELYRAILFDVKCKKKQARQW